MPRDARACLWEAGDAADAVADFLAGIDFATYAATPLIHSAVERKCAIVGEALNTLSKIDPAVARRVPDLPRIVAFRNLLIHGYAVVEHDRVWRIATDDLPRLRAVITGLLDELGPP